jgi:hypothetical protein
MTASIVLERQIAVNEYNETVYETPEMIACRHVVRTRRVQTPTGIVIVGEDRLRYTPGTGLKVGDRVTLPDGRIVLVRITGQGDLSGEVWTEWAICE